MRMTGRGPRSSGMIRYRGCKSRAVLTVPERGLSAAEPGYRRTYGEETKLALEASVFTVEAPAARDSVGAMVCEPDWLEYLVWWHRHVDAATESSFMSVARAPRGRAGRLQGPWVMSRNVGTCTRPPVHSTSAISSESREGRVWGRSSRSSRRPGKPATGRRGAGAS
jgi:hypothetical protein